VVRDAGDGLQDTYVIDRVALYNGRGADTILCGEPTTAVFDRAAPPEGLNIMATAKIVPVGPGEIELITDLYNDVFSPRQEPSFFEQRFRGRYNVSMLVAIVEERHVGFAIGFELMPSTYFSWICGVLPDYRRTGVATQLIQGQRAWAQDNEYSILRFECQNQHRPMLHVAISEGFDAVGIRWDTATGNNVVIFEKDLR